MAIVCLVIIVLLLLLELKLQKSFISPISLLLLSLIMSFILIAINQKNWDVTFNITFLLYLTIAILSFSVSCFIVELLSCNIRKNEEKNTVKGLSVLIDWDDYCYPAKPFFIISFLCMVVYFIMMLRHVGLYGGITSVLARIYADLSLKAGGNFIMHQMIEIVIAIAEVNLFAFFLIKYLGKGRERIKSYNWIFFQFLFYSVCVVLSTDRNKIIRFVIYFLVLWILFEFEKNKENINKANKTIFVRSLFVVISVVLLFFWLGKMKNSSSDFGRTIGIYGGSGIYNYNLFLLREQEYQFGESTFLLLCNTLKSFGLIGGEAAEEIIVDDFVIFRSYNGFIYHSNVYSALRRYTEDFGMIGLVVFPGFLGVFFETLYVFTKRNKYGLAWALYALMVYPVVYFVIDEQFFRRMHLGVIYELGWFMFFYILAFGIPYMKREYQKKCMVRGNYELQS